MSGACGLGGLSALSARANTRDAHVLAGAGRERDDTADHLVGVARIDAQVQRDFDGFVELGGGVASSRGRSPRRRHAASRGRWRLPGPSAFLVSFAMFLALHHFEAHRAGGAFDDLGRSVDVVRIEIDHLRLGDFGAAASA